MTRTSWVFFLVVVLAAIPFAAPAATPSTLGMAAQIVSASPAQTVVAADFDPTLLRSRLENSTIETGVSDGFGVVLAVAGQGTPTARVISYELGETVGETVVFDNRQLAMSADELLILSDPGILNELRLVGLNFRPILRSTTGDLRLVTRIEAEVATTGIGGANPQDEPTSFSQAWFPIYRSLVSNFDEVYPEVTPIPPGRYLVIASTRTLQVDLPPTGQWQRWLDLKIRKGYHMQLVTLGMIYSAVGDSHETGIRQYIQQTYGDRALPKLEYALILGDESGSIAVPTWRRPNPERPQEQSVGDLHYFTINGNDYFPDVLYGRVCALQNRDLLTLLNKAYRYEAETDVSSMEWFEAGTFVAGNYTDAETYPVTPVWNVNWAREWLLRDACMTDSDTFYYHNPSDPPPGQYRQAIRNDIDQGVSLVMYRGWANAPGWQRPVWEVSDVGLLANGARLHAVFSIVCGSGNFAYEGTCLGEAWTSGMETQNQTPNQLNGALSFFGASDLHTNTRHNNAILAGMIEAMLTQGIRSTHAIDLAGQMEAWRQFPLERDGETSLVFFYVFHVFNLLGDPETPLFVCRPSTFDAINLPQLHRGETLIPVAVRDLGQPVENAVVTLREPRSTDVHSAVTDEAGVAWLSLLLNDEADTVQLTVWKSHYLMRRMDIPVVSPDFDPQIISANWMAGGDNLPNPGETVQFTLTVLYRGSAATDLSATISTSDPRLVVNNGNVTFGNVQPGATVTSTAAGISLGGDLFDGERPTLDVQFTGNGTVMRHMEVPVAGPEPVIASLTISDGNNGILEAGELADVYVTIQNIGHQSATGLTAQVGSHDNAISFVDEEMAWPQIDIGGQGTTNGPFRAILAQGVTPGRQIHLLFVFLQNGVVVHRKSFFLSTGVVAVTSPTGPDPHGYYAYEDLDTGFPGRTPTYYWIELDPDHGGSGAEAHEVRDDTHFRYNLPLSFMFYGQNYDTLWICSNGWFSFERAMLPEFRNWELPSPIGPPSMVCPFWDDLIIDRTWPNNDSLHSVWTRYDAPQNRLIVQWRTMNRAGLAEGGLPNEAFCTFEAILEFPAAGNGSIVFQYNQIANVDGQNSGNFATVGIEDSYHRRGLNLTYAGFYPASMDSLRPGRAIRITTSPPDNFSSADELAGSLPTQFALHAPHPNPFNPSTELRFDLPQSGQVSLRVFDVLGREVAVLVDDFHAAGSYRVSFDGRALSSGLYFARLVANDRAQVRKLMLVR